MPSFGERSQASINTCDADLQRLFQVVVRGYDCSALCGHRNEQQQNSAYNAKRSKKVWPESKHNKLPSDALDIAPYPIQWGDVGTDKERRKALARFYHFAGYVKAKAEMLGIKVRWGGDWDSDLDFSDQNFDDLPHWELVK